MTKPVKNVKNTKGKFLVKHAGFTIGQQAPAEYVEGRQGEERAIGVRLLHQYRYFLTPGEQQPPEIPKGTI